MGRPLDTQSRILGLFRINDLYILIGSFIFGLVFLPALTSFMRIGYALGVYLSIIILEAAYFILAGKFPDGFFVHMLTFRFEDQAYYPGKETPKDGTK